MAPSEDGQTEDAPQLERLDPQGDLILAVGGRRLLVSSRVLVLSSSFFERMLRSGAFAEGRDPPNPADPPVKTLDDQDPHTFRFLCCLLHYRPADPPKSVAQFVALADTCNFYGVLGALSFHLQVWINSLNIPAFSHDDQKKLLWVAFVFRQNSAFEYLSRRLAFGLTKEELSSWEVHPMPESLKDDLCKMRASIRVKIERLVEIAIDKVREDNEGQVSCDAYDVCKSCDRVVLTNFCSRCSAFGSSYNERCLKSRRLLIFMDWIQDKGLWPFHRQRDIPCEQLEQLTAGALLSAVTHKCKLPVTQRALLTKIQAALAEHKGLDLNSYYLPHG